MRKDLESPALNVGDFLFRVGVIKQTDVRQVADVFLVHE